MATLTGTQVANRVKRQFGDEAGAQINDTMILDWINDGQAEIVQRTDELFQTKATASTTAGTAEYSLPTVATNIIRMNRVFYKGNSIRPISIQQAEELYPEKDMTPRPQGIPEAYWIWANKIIFEPAPDATGAFLTVYFQTYPTNLAAIGDSLTLPERYHLKVVDYCIAKAAELDDDDERFLNKMAAFNADVDQMQQDTYWENQNLYPFPALSMEDMTYGAGYGQ